MEDEERRRLETNRSGQRTLGVQAEEQLEQEGRWQVVVELVAVAQHACEARHHTPHHRLLHALLLLSVLCAAIRSDQIMK